MSATLIMRATTSGLGGAPTSTEISSTPMNNIYNNINFAEATAGSIKYRAIDIYNEGDEDAVDVEIYMSTPTSSTDTLINMGVTTPHISSTVSIGNEDTLPVGASFSYHDSSSTLSVDTIPSGSYARVWLERVVTAGASNTSEDLGSIAFSYA